MICFIVTHSCSKVLGRSVLPMLLSLMRNAKKYSNICETLQIKIVS